MKNTRSLIKNMGLTLVVFLVIFGLADDYLFAPLLGKLWGLALATTPDGFISNANLVNSLLKSPWIIPIGLALIVISALIVLWEASAMIVGIYYARKGQNISFTDLVRISFRQLRGQITVKNWMILVCALVILPLANIYHTSEIFNTVIFPEYIQDFIDSKTVLFILFIVVMTLIFILSIAWYFLFPSFFLKSNRFKEASRESFTLSSKNLLKNLVNVEIHYIIEIIRFSIIPILIVLIPVGICYLATRDLKYSARLFSSIALSKGLEITQNITGSLVELSVLVFLVNLYFERLKARGMSEDTTLPEIQSKKKPKLSLNALLGIACLIFSALVAVFYTVTVNVAQKDSSVILDTIGTTEVIAHKGYSSKAPENTMPAFELADNSEDVSMIELDVWSTRDGIPVVIHNSSIKDATGIDREIYECTYEEIKDLPAPYAMSIEEFPSATIPTLEEVLKTYAENTPILIEIKGFSQDPELPSKIVDLMKKYDCDRSSQIQSGDYAALKAVKKIDSGIECGLILAMVTGSYYDLIYADFFSIEHTFVNQDTVALLERRGKQVYAWTVNYSDSVEKLEWSGVHGLITDYPETIAGYVSDKNDLVEEAIRWSIESIFKKNIGSAIENYLDGEY